VRGIAIVAVLVVAFTGVSVADAGIRHTHKHKHHHAKKHKKHRKQHAKPAQPAPAPAPAPPQLKPASFDGSCEFSGAVTFTPPMTSAPQPTAQHANAPGTCTGTFVDGYGGTHQLDGAAAAYRAESSGDSVSCLFGVASGTGTLTFPDGEIAFAMTEYRGGATPLIRLTGKSGGEAWMPVTPSQSSDPAAAVAACNGAGLERFDLDAHMQTMERMSG
jgi:hypothetical protein